MRTLALIGLVLALVAATALASPLVAAALAAAGFHFRFSRVWNRVFEVLLVVALVACWRRLDLGRPRELGLARRAWARELGVGFAIGLAGIAAGLLACWLGGALEPAVRFSSAVKTARKALSGAAAAALVGIGEEALFRGVLLRRLMRDCGRTAGMVLATGLYAVVHALRPGGGGSAHAGAGIERALALFAPLADPRVIPAVLALAAFGGVLLLARLGSGSLWLCIGIHAAWVATFRVGRLFFDVGRTPVWLVGPGWPPIVGGAAGWLAIALTFVLLRALLERTAPGRAGPATSEAPA